MGVRDILPAIWLVISGAGAIYLAFRNRNASLFWRLIKLPFTKLRYRGLFNFARPKYFWGRDPYNEDHVLRRQELNRVGGKSFGVNTGYLTWSIYIPAWRYISYDRFYVFGKGKYEKYYGGTWAQDMEIVPAGTFTAQRYHYANRFKARNTNIAVFISVFAGEPEVVQLVRKLGMAFPDREITLQTKSNFQIIRGLKEFYEACSQGLPNVRVSTESVYDIFVQSQYGISDPSSVVVEAIQFGMYMFALDVPHLQVSNVNREYPDLTFTDPNTVIERIRRIEAGTETYPFTSYKDLVDLSGTIFFDRVRLDMGLKPREKSISLIP